LSHLATGAQFIFGKAAGDRSFDLLHPRGRGQHLPGILFSPIRRGLRSPGWIGGGAMGGQEERKPDCLRNQFVAHANT
jgi:hypothetical protein